VAAGSWAKTIPTMTLAAFAIWFSYTYASPLPYGDEYELVEVLVGERPCDFAYLFSRHNEHRLPVPRLVMHRLLPLYGYNFRLLAATVPAIISVGLLSYFVSLRLSGRAIAWTDNAYAALLLNPGHAENFLWGWQVQYAINVALVFAIAGILLLPRWRYGPAVCGVLLVCMMGCGVNGILTAVPLWLGTSLKFGFERRWDRTGQLYALIAAVGMIIGMISLRTGQPNTLNFSLEALSGVVAFFACLAGPAAQSHWQAVGFLALSLSLALLSASAFRVARYRDSDCIFPLCLMAVLFLFGAAVGLRRTSGDASEAFQYRYFLLTTLWLLGAFTLLATVPDAWARASRAVLLAISIFIGFVNVQPGYRYAASFHSKQQALKEDLSAGLPLRLLAEKYYSHPFGLYSPSSQSLFERLEKLRAAGLTTIKTAKTSPETLVVDVDSGGIRYDEASGRIILQNPAVVHGVTWSWQVANAYGGTPAAFGVFNQSSGGRATAGLVRRLGPLPFHEAIQVEGEVASLGFQKLAAQGDLLISDLKIFVVVSRADH
jgi:hypothetical protein